MKRKMLSLFVTVAMVCSLFTGWGYTAAAVSVSDFTDMPAESDWSYAALSAAVDSGLLQGTDGALLPGNKLTRAELATMINRAFGAKDASDVSGFADVSANDWFHNEIAKAVRMGTFKGDGASMRPNDPISRQEAFAVLARAFKLEDGTSADLSKFSDANEVSSWAVPALAAMTKAGYISGNGGMLRPLDTITRAEFAQVMHNMLGVYCTESKTYTELGTGNVMVNAAGVTLQGVKVAGDLIIGEGVGDGEVTLDGVEVTGRMVVRGGGEHSIILTNNSSVGSVLIGKTGDGGVRVRTEEGCRVEAVVIDDGKDDIILEGEFNQVAIATDTPVVLKDANVTGLTVKAENASVSLDGTTKVTAVQINENAAGAAVEVSKTAEVATVVSKAEKVEISGEGTVKSAEISGNDTTVDTKGTSVTVASGTEGVKQDGKSVEPSKTEETKTTPSAGGGGSSGGGGGSVTHTHSWAVNVLTGATETDAGEKEIYCTGCSKKTTAPYALKPFTVTKDETVTAYGTLEEAIQAAKKEGTNPVEYEDIEQIKPTVVNDLNLPDGCTLRVKSELFIVNKLTFNSSGAAGSEENYGNVVVTEKGEYAGEITFWNNGNDERYGFSQDCDVQMTSKGGNNTPGVLVFSKDYRMMMGGDVVFNSSCSLKDYTTIRSYFGDDPNTYTVTIPEGVTVDMIDGKIAGAVDIINNGTLNINGDVELEKNLTNYGTLNVIGTLAVGGTLTNNGTLNVNVTKKTATGEEDPYICAVLRMESGAKLENNSLININCIEIKKNEEYRNARINCNGADLINNKDAVIYNNGELIQEIGNGCQYRKGFLLQGYNIVCQKRNTVFKNEGIIINNAAFDIHCDEAASSGVITNYNTMILENGLKGEISYTLEKKENPTTEEGWANFWNRFWGWCDEEDYYWYETEITAGEVTTLGGCFVNSGTLNNYGDLICRNITFANEFGGTLNNAQHFGVESFTKEDACWWDNKEDSIKNITYPEFNFINKGTFANGSITGTGEANNGSDASYDQTYGAFTNEGNGEVTNNGSMQLNYVALTNTGKNFETYNTGGLQIRGGTQDIKTTIYNEGYMKVIDEYYDAGGEDSKNQICDSMENVKRKTQDDSDWIDWTAAVYSKDGLTAAEAAQEKRVQENSDDIYNRLDFCRDITIDGEKELSAFEEYWVVDYYDEENDKKVGAKLTVSETGKLTIGNNTTLHVSGWYDNESKEGAVPELIINEGGSLTTKAEIQEQRSEEGEKTQEYQSPGAVVLWPVSRFANSGKVDNQGSFEVYMLEGMYEQGKFDHHGKCFGIPDNAFYTADVRTFAGLQQAVSFVEIATESESGVESIGAPQQVKYKRITIRENCTVTVTKDFGIPMMIDNVYIEPGSGLIVEHGSTLTLNCNTFDNQGDITVWGNMVIGENCEFKNRQNLEVGAVSGGQQAVVTVNGKLYNWNHIGLYQTGSVVLGNRCYVHNDEWKDSERVYLPVTVATNAWPEYVFGVAFKDELNLNSTADGIRYEFYNCTFDKDINLFYTDTTHDGIEAEFFNSCTFKEEVKINVTVGEGIDLSDKSDYINICGASGASVNAQNAPVQVSCAGENGAACTLNGVRGELLITEEGQEFSDGFCLSLRYEDQGEDNSDKKVFQVDSNNNCTAKLTGTLSGTDQNGTIDELRLQQGGIDISELTVGENTTIVIHDQFRPTSVNIGSKTVTIDDYYNKNDAEENVYYSYNITADRGAVINVNGAQMEYASDHYAGTNLNLTYNGTTYNSLNPHIFGFKFEGTSTPENQNPGIYIGSASDIISYLVNQGETSLEYGEPERIQDKNKTHLRPETTTSWFKVNKDEEAHYIDPMITLGMRFGEGGPTVIYDTVPLKPEWDETN